MGEELCSMEPCEVAHVFDGVAAEFDVMDAVCLVAIIPLPIWTGMVVVWGDVAVFTMGGVVVQKIITLGMTVVLDEGLCFMPCIYRICGEKCCHVLLIQVVMVLLLSLF